jgi:hypothetical protein
LRVFRVRGLGCEARGASHPQAFLCLLVNPPRSPRASSRHQPTSERAAGRYRPEAEKYGGERSKYQGKDRSHCGRDRPPVAAAVRGDCQQPGHHNLHASSGASKFFCRCHPIVGDLDFRMSIRSRSRSRQAAFLRQLTERARAQATLRASEWFKGLRPTLLFVQVASAHLSQCQDEAPLGRDTPDCRGRRATHRL